MNNTLQPAFHFTAKLRGPRIQQIDNFVKSNLHEVTLLSAA